MMAPCEFCGKTSVTFIVPYRCKMHEECEINYLSSRICSRGIKSCVVFHETPEDAR